MLVVGNQRSYSDVCCSDATRKGRSQIIAYWPQDGIIRAAGGTTLYEIIARIKRDGWTLPAAPGTGWATVGGCIANDVHGKNHQAIGSFGNHIQAIELEDKWIFPRNDLFHATIGGLGLTGEIKWAEIKLVRGRSFLPWLFPLDYIPRYWETYKKLGFWQFHCVVNNEFWVPHVFDCLRQPPLLVVKKKFGNIPSAGMLSFCRPGISLSFDFAYKDTKMLAKLENAACLGGGAVYPAKTSMSAETFQFSFPRWKEFAKYVHPDYSSDFWRRVSV